MTPEIHTILTRLAQATRHPFSDVKLIRPEDEELARSALRLHLEKKPLEKDGRDR